MVSRLNIKYNQESVSYNELLTIDKTAKEPKISFNFDPKQKYTIIMVDPDAPSPTRPINKYWLHWLRVNTTDGIVPYAGPNPPLDENGKLAPHRYYIRIYQQNMSLEPTILKNTYKGGGKFDLDGFVAKYQLTLIAETQFKVAYSKKN